MFLCSSELRSRTNRAWRGGKLKRIAASRRRTRSGKKAASAAVDPRHTCSHVEPSSERSIASRRGKSRAHSPSACVIAGDLAHLSRGRRGSTAPAAVGLSSPFGVHAAVGRQHRASAELRATATIGIASPSGVSSGDAPESGTPCACHRSATSALRVTPRRSAPTRHRDRQPRRRRRRSRRGTRARGASRDRGVQPGLERHIVRRIVAADTVHHAVDGARSHETSPAASHSGPSGSSSDRHATSRRSTLGHCFRRRGHGKRPSPIRREAGSPPPRRIAMARVARRPVASQA